MENEEFEYAILYSEELDAWILSKDLEPDNKGNYKGTIIYVGENKSLNEQQDELLDLILKNDEYNIYYKEILSLMSK
jgi:hypothetical protein